MCGDVSRSQGSLFLRVKSDFAIQSGNVASFLGTTPSDNDLVVVFIYKN